MRRPASVCGAVLVGAALCACLPPASSAAAAARSAAAPAKPHDPLSAALDAILSRPALAAASLAVEVRRLADGHTLYSRDAGRALHPASCLKLVTTAAALDALGSDARLRTTVETAARLDGFGRLLGDVYLVGRGDPSLSSRFENGNATAAFDGFAAALAASGVRRIEGRVLGHEGAFPGERRGSDWSWEDLVWGYGAEVSALSLDENAVGLRLIAGERAGDPALVELLPPSPLLSVVNAVGTSSGDTPQAIRLEKDAGSNRVRLTGSMPVGSSWSGRVAVEDPALFAATAFAQRLEARGVAVAGGARTTSAPLPPGVRVLAEHVGAPVAAIVRATNKESLNLPAEMLLRLVGLHASGEGTLENGTQAVTAFLQRVGVRLEGWQLRDGCGLSRGDLVTAGGLADLLVAMARHPRAADFLASLPVAGRDGTLEGRLRGTPAEGRVQAKTGTLDLAHGLAGYATDQRGVRLAFVVLVNNAPARDALAAIDAVARAVVLGGRDSGS